MCYYFDTSSVIESAFEQITDTDADTLLKLKQQTCMKIIQCNDNYMQKLQCKKTPVDKWMLKNIKIT